MGVEQIVSEEQMKYIANLMLRVLEQDEEIERLNNIIDKAIEYMDNLKIEDFSTRSQYGYLLVDYNRLVSILMGKPRFTNEKENN